MTERYGSDLVVEGLQALGVEYAAVNPGASYRGMHASLVHLGAPELILALQENTAVAIGHGYAKSTGKPMAVFLHNLVGLQSGAMGIFNAWADQVPMMVLGGSGPSDASSRRPWIDWVHSARLQSLVVRDSLKWDDQPTSLAAIPDSLVRAHRIASTAPCGPTYVSVDVGLQEALVPDGQAVRLRGPRTPPGITAPEDTIEEIASLLVRAERPVMVADSVGRSEAGYDALQRLAEALAAPVIDMMGRHNFPTGHWADGTPGRREALADADVVLCLDLRDLWHGIGEIDHDGHGYRPLVSPTAKVISVSLNQLMLRGFIDFAGPEDAAFEIVADTALWLPLLADVVEGQAGERVQRREAVTELTAGWRQSTGTEPPAGTGTVSYSTLANAVHGVLADGPWELANGLARGHVRRSWDLSRFNAHLGESIGAGLGYGMGVSIGAALAHRHDDTLVVNLQADGDLMYTAGALWTAARYDLPMLNVIVNNRTYFQDRMHQSIVAKERNHPLENAQVGIDIDDPNLDFASLARSQGVEAWGPVTDQSELGPVLEEAARMARDETRPVLVDVVVPR